MLKLARILREMKNERVDSATFNAALTNVEPNDLSSHLDFYVGDKDRSSVKALFHKFVMHSLIHGSHRKKLANIMYNEKFKPMLNLLHQQFKKDHADCVAGNTAKLYRGLYIPKYKEPVFNKVGRMHLNDDITLYTKEFQYQGFTPNLEIARKFAQGHDDIGESSDKSQDAYGIVVQCSVNIDSIIYYYDFYPQEEYMHNEFEEEQEVVADMEKTDDLGQIVEAYWCDRIKWREILNPYMPLVGIWPSFISIDGKTFIRTNSTG